MYLHLNCDLTCMLMTPLCACAVVGAVPDQAWRARPDLRRLWRGGRVRDPAGQEGEIACMHILRARVPTRHPICLPGIKYCLTTVDSGAY